MPRETKALSIDGHNFIVKTYATAREANAIQSTYFKGSKVEVIGDQAKMSEFNPGVQQEVEKELVNQMVVSLDDNIENIVERCLDLPSDIYRELLVQLDTLTSKKKN